MNNVTTLLASAIADPTDFPITYPSLRGLDSALRCNICSELFDAPVTLPCGHCFCSVCIRGAIGVKTECPTCRKTCNEGHLRTNPAMEEAVGAWTGARDIILRLSKAEESRLSRPKSSRPLKGRKRKRDASGSSQLRKEEDESDDSTLRVPTSDPAEEEVGIAISGSEDVMCPMCTLPVPLISINEHMDAGCPHPMTSTTMQEKRKASKSQWGKILGNGPNTTSNLKPKSKGKGKATEEQDEAMDPLPKVTYATLKDRQLKDLLSAFDLPTTGGREVLIRRHERWVIIYNANIDRSRSQRRSIAELRNELKFWEGSSKKVSTSKVGAGADSVAYQKANKEEFKTLIEAARPKKVLDRVGGTVSSPTPQHASGVNEDDIIAIDSEEDRINV